MSAIEEENKNKVNNGDVDDSGKIVDVNDIEYVVAKYPSGLVEKIEWIDDTKAATKSTIYLPVGDDPISTDDEQVLKTESAKYRTLESQEAITGIIVYRLREKQ